MQPERRPPDDPVEWMTRARSNLALAKSAGRVDEVLFEDLCFDCQQAVEKALKGLLVSRKTLFPKTHNIPELMTLIQNQGIDIPDGILEAAKLTGYSVSTRYPGLDEPVTKEEYLQAISLAERVVVWVQDLLLK